MHTPPAAARMPAVFFGHGSPMSTLERNRYTNAWSEAGRRSPRPRAVLMVSAHWYTRGTGVTAMDAPRTIHDFHGFPPELYAIRYPAPGDPALARRVRELLTPQEVALDGAWGLDHGAWAVLRHAFPDADVPVLQLSIDATRPAAWHLETGRRLAALREESVMIAGSGNVVHHLGMMRGGTGAPAHPWAIEFERWVSQRLAQLDDAALADYERQGPSPRLSVPTPEHYLPLLYVLGSRRDDDRMEILVDGVELGSISMLSFAIGLPA